MVNSLPVVLAVGTVLGFLSALGIGGGSLLLLWLTAIAGASQSTARSINLLFFLPCAVIACLFRWRQGKLPFQKLLPAILAGCAAAALLSWAGTKLNTELMKKLFGALLLFAGLREIFYRPRKAR